MEPSYDDGSSVAEDELTAGMQVQLRGLTGKAELNGRTGALIKFDVDGDRWQVDLGSAAGIKLVSSWNLLACGIPDVSHSSSMTFNCD